jgi:hypothetical protein
MLITVEEQPKLFVDFLTFFLSPIQTVIELAALFSLLV